MTISSAVSLLIVGLLLVAFVIIAPNGIVGLVAGLAAREGEVMAAPLLEVAGLSKRFGGFVALDGIDLAVAEGERVGLIGPNGSGKSTLVNCICGTLTNETGTVRFNGETDRRPAGARAHPPRPRAQLPAAAAVRQPDGRRKPARAAALHRQRAARRAALAGRDRRALRRAAAAGRPRRQGRPASARPHPGGDAQARAGARHGGRAEAPDRRRRPWPACRSPRSPTSSRC